MKEFASRSDETEIRQQKKNKNGAYPGRRNWTVRIQWINGSMDQLINQSIHGKVESRVSVDEGRKGGRRRRREEEEAGVGHFKLR